MYDTIGIPSTREASCEYGKTATKPMYDIAKAKLSLGESVMIESAFDVEHAGLDIRAILDVYPRLRVAQLYCHSDAREMMKRFNGHIQSGERHRGHPDVIHEDVEYFEAMRDRYAPIAGLDTITVDTTNPVDSCDELVKHILERIGN